MPLRQRQPAAGSGQGRDAVHAADAVHVHAATRGWPRGRAPCQDEAHQLGLAPRPVRDREHHLDHIESQPAVAVSARVCLGSGSGGGRWL